MAWSARLEYRSELQTAGDSLIALPRWQCACPIIIKGCNIRGEHYDEVALIEDVGWRGICFRTSQPLLPGFIFSLYHTEDELASIATCETIWTKSSDLKIRRIGAQLVGDNRAWMEFLLQEVVNLPGTRMTRGMIAASH